MTDTPETAEQADTGAIAPAAASGGMWKWWLLGFLILLTIWNATVTVPVMTALSDEENATTVVYRRWLISPNQIVFDIWSVDSSQSMADIDRRLFKAAEALKDRSYDNVVFAHRGDGKFLLEGSFFQTTGQTRQTQNPVYTIRTMPENVMNMDGTPAFGTWTGGLIGVAGQQFEDHNDMHMQWWINDASGMDDTQGY